MEDLDYLRKAYLYAQIHSHDPNTQTGAILVSKNQIIARGANSFPDGVQRLNERLQRPLKYSFIEHAERNAIFSAANKSIRTKGSTMYSPWVPCVDCARAVIQAGITEYVSHQFLTDLYSQDPRIKERWDESIGIGLQMLKEAGVKHRSFKDEIGDVGVLFGGNIIKP